MAVLVLFASFPKWQEGFQRLPLDDQFVSTRSGNWRLRHFAQIDRVIKEPPDKQCFKRLVFLWVKNLVFSSCDLQIPKTFLTTL